MAYGLTQSLDLERSSAQTASIADASQTGLDPSTNFTIEGWVNLESLPATGEEYVIFSKFASANRQYYFYARNIAGVQQLRLSVGNAGAGACDNSDASYQVSWSPSTATWYHVAVVKNGTQASFYVDGVQQGSTGGTLNTNVCNGGAAAIVGDTTFTGAAFDGKINLLRFWTVARTVTEINDNKCNVLGSTTNLSAEWTFNNVYTDNSGNSNTLTANNSPVFVTDTPSTCGVAFIPTPMIHMMQITGGLM